MIKLFSCRTWWLSAGTFPVAFGLATSWLWFLNGLKISLKCLTRLIDIWLVGKKKKRTHKLKECSWKCVLLLFISQSVTCCSNCTCFIIMYFRFGKVEDKKDALRLYTVQIPHKRDRRPPPCYLTKWDGKSFLPMLTAPCGIEVISSVAIRWMTFAIVLNWNPFTFTTEVIFSGLCVNLFWIQIMEHMEEFLFVRVCAN